MIWCQESDLVNCAPTMTGSNLGDIRKNKKIVQERKNTKAKGSKLIKEKHVRKKLAIQSIDNDKLVEFRAYIHTLQDIPY